jgi:phosphopantothenoylcysteine decarboxylase/phosphopantothenate--cysteine ligase
MRCIVTAGPTAEPLDQVRRLTNFSTGRLGSELANFLSERGHQVTLLVGQQATWRGERRAQLVQSFTTTANLRESLRDLAELPFDAVFHAAAVSDFTFGRVWRRAPSGELSEIRAGKVASRLGVLLAELVPTPKIIAELRGWFAKARLVGWKYEVEGNRSGVIELAEKQMTECLTDACVANGPAYGAGFGLVRRLGTPRHLAGDLALFKALEQIVDGPAARPAPSSRG